MTVGPDDKPWYNNMLRMLCRRKTKLHRLVKHQNIAESWARFKQACNDYVYKVSVAKDHHEQKKYTYLFNYNKSTETLWSVVKEIQTSNDACESIPPTEVGGDIVKDDRDKASVFNDLFLESSTLGDRNAELPRTL